jgi:polysaccharide export outer membrane protein
MEVRVMHRVFVQWCLCCAVALLSFAVLAGCSSQRPPPPRNLPVATPSTTVGPGDMFEVHVMGETNLPKDFRVQPDGSINFPYVDKIQVAGLEPQQIEALIKTKLKEAKILQEPQVSIVVRTYASKKVTVIGQVARPGNLPFTEGMKLVEAISLSGWFTPIGDSNHIILTRQVADKKTVTAVISVDAITDGAQPDIPLQAGDTIKVEQKVF